MTMTTWRKEIGNALQGNGESWESVLRVAIPEGGLDKEFDDGYGGHEGDPFTVWTEQNVYFPIVYDGAEWVGCVERHPSDIATEHQGGE